MKTSLLFVPLFVGAWLAVAFAQEDKPAPPKDNPPRAERKEGDRPPPPGDRPAPPRREGEAGEGPRRPPGEGPPPRREGDMGPPRREGGREGDRPMPPPRGEDGPRPPRGEGDFGPPPRRDGDFGPPRREGDFGPPPRRPEGPGFGAGDRGPGGRGGFHHLEQEDPEMFAIMQKDHDLDRQALDVAQRMKGAPKTEREKLKTELTEVVRKHFEARQERRTLQMKRVEDDLKRLKDQIEARSKARDEIISRRVTELTGDESDLGF